MIGGEIMRNNTERRIALIGLVALAEVKVPEFHGRSIERRNSFISELKVQRLVIPFELPGLKKSQRGGSRV